VEVWEGGKLRSHIQEREKISAKKPQPGGKSGREPDKVTDVDMNLFNIRNVEPGDIVSKSKGGSLRPRTRNNNEIGEKQTTTEIQGRQGQVKSQIKPKMENIKTAFQKPFRPSVLGRGPQ